MDNVDLLRLFRIFALEILDLLSLFIRRKLLVIFNALHGFRDVGNNERLRVVG